MSAEPIEKKLCVFAGHLKVANQHVQKIIATDAQPVQFGRFGYVIRPGLTTKRGCFPIKLVFVPRQNVSEFFDDFFGGGDVVHEIDFGFG